MWPDLIIPISLMTWFTIMPTVVVPLYAKYIQGNQWYPKNVEDDWVLHFHHRDLHLSKDPWRPWGIEHIPDVPPKIDVD